MAVGAFEIPVLLHPGPVQRIAGLDGLFRVKMKPALAALGLGPRIPGDGQRLKPPAGKLQQILLERRDAEHELDLVVGERAVGSVGAHDELAVPPRERRRHVAVAEMRVVEIAAHRGFVRRLHRERVMRALPVLDLRSVALRAGLAADVGCELWIRPGRREGARRVKCARDRQRIAEERDRQNHPADDREEPPAGVRSRVHDVFLFR